MTRVLLTAFEPFGPWTENSSWLALVELTRDLPTEPRITTRRYPVDFVRAKEQLVADLSDSYDAILHLGQATGAEAIQLESIAVNVGGDQNQTRQEHFALETTGPVAYRSRLPLPKWCEMLNDAGIPCRVSYHAGTYLCNALFYWSCFLAEANAIDSRVTLIHLPLEHAQVIGQGSGQASLSCTMTANALRMILQSLTGGDMP